MGNFYKIKANSNINYVNPYNFISLNDTGCVRYNPYIGNESYTGYLDVELTTKTETIVPDTNVEDKTKPVFEFFSYDDKNTKGFRSPVIPGSEIRGMLRSDFEAFTDSCMSTVNEMKSFISRVKNAKNPGILKKDENGNWQLYPAKRYPLHTTRIWEKERFEKDKFEKDKIANPRDREGDKEAIYMVGYDNKLKYKNDYLSTGKEVQFITKQNKGGPEYVLEITDNAPNCKTGILFIGELGVNKSITQITRNGVRDPYKINHIHDSIFEYSSDKPINVNQKELSVAVEKLKDIIDVYQDKGINKNISKKGPKGGTWYEGYNVNKLKEVPVWYSRDDKDPKAKIYLSPAAIGKEAYHRTLNELLNVTGDQSKSYMPCIDNSNLCETCNIFGFTSNNNARSSKIRISDALYLGNENPYSEARFLELANPHIDNVAFYSLFKTNEDLIGMKNVNLFWTYDYCYENGKYISIPKMSIRGRKMYWHHTPKINKENNNFNNRNFKAIPVKVGTKFAFKVYFENLGKKELQDLIAVINLNYDSELKTNNNEKYYDLCHKLGKAKPYGYGSVKLEVKDAKIREVNKENDIVSYKMLNIKDKIGLDLNEISINNLFDLNKQSIKDALRIYNFNYIKDNYSDCEVTYPIGEDKQINSMKWFVLNKDQELKSKSNPYILMTLPLIRDGKEIATNAKPLTGVIDRDGYARIEIDGLKIPKLIKENNGRR